MNAARPDGEPHLVPLVFEPYAEDLAGQLRSQPITRLLEIAAVNGSGTSGALTR